MQILLFSLCLNELYIPASPYITIALLIKAGLRVLLDTDDASVSITVHEKRS